VPVKEFSVSDLHSFDRVTQVSGEEDQVPHRSRTHCIVNVWAPRTKTMYRLKLVIIGDDVIDRRACDMVAAIADIGTLFFLGCDLGRTVPSIL
jgi:hypothetical protein